MANHRDTHPDYVDDCFACKALSVRVDSGAAKATNAADRQLARDRDAYLQLRRSGLQPKHVDGSSELVKRVDSQHDIDLGRYVPPSERSRVEEGYALAREIGVSPWA